MTGYILLGVFIGMVGSAGAMGAWYVMHRTEWATKRRLKKSGERGCWSCKHTDKSYDEEPCCYCDALSEWEATER